MWKLLAVLAMFAAPASASTRYVAPSGSDSADGLTTATAYRSIGRALNDIPAVVDDHWTVRLAGGEYPESVSLRRFVMPATLSTQQLRFEPISRAISLVGDAGAVIAPTAGSPCLSVAGAVLFLDTLACRVSGANGISASGSTVVLDDVRIEAPATASHAIYAELSLVYFGGNFEVEGPFNIGVAARTGGLARTGTRRNQATANLTFTGLAAQAIFVRDGGNFTSAFETGTIRVVSSNQAIYALLGSQVFLSSGMTLVLENVNVGIVATQRSGINVSSVVVTGTTPSPFARCFLGSYLVLESVSAPPGRSADTDGSCTNFVY